MVTRSGAPPALAIASNAIESSHAGAGLSIQNEKRSTMITMEYLSYENEAALLVGNFSPDGIDFDLDAATYYTQIFLEDYRLALLSPHTTPESFLHADRKSTRLNSSHANISYAVFCLK